MVLKKTNLKGPNLATNGCSIKEPRLLCRICPDTTDKVWFSVNQRPEKIIETSMEILRQGRDGIVSVKKVRV